MTSWDDDKIRKLLFPFMDRTSGECFNKHHFTSFVSISFNLNYLAPPPPNKIEADESKKFLVATNANANKHQRVAHLE